MKVLMINSSPKKNGCTFTALSEIARTLDGEGIESEILHLGADPIRDCIGCGACSKIGKCAFDDDIVNSLVEKAPRSRPDSYSAPPFITLTRRGGFSAHSTARFIPAKVPSLTSPAPPSLPRDAPERPRRSMY